MIDNGIFGEEKNVRYNPPRPGVYSSEKIALFNPEKLMIRLVFGGKDPNFERFKYLEFKDLKICESIFQTKLEPNFLHGTWLNQAGSQSAQIVLLSTISSPT